MKNIEKRVKRIIKEMREAEQKIFDIQHKEIMKMYDRYKKEQYKTKGILWLIQDKSDFLGHYI